jgi:RHS repeat-associated protein
MPDVCEIGSFREFQSESNFSYYRARYYDQNVGRFLSEDPIRFAADVNFYSYVDNHVTGAKDPSGHDPAVDAITVANQIYGYYLCADQIKNEFNHFSREGHPRYAHCMASCNLVKRCGGKAAAFLTGYAKETGDLWDCLRTGKRGSCNTAFQQSDLDDNAQGRSCPKNKRCEDQCLNLRDLPDSAPSWWIYGGPILRGIVGIGIGGGNSPITRTY